jgi:hypothetical protein
MAKEFDKLLKELDSKLKKIVKEEIDFLRGDINNLLKTVDDMRSENNILTTKMTTLQEISDKWFAENILLKETLDQISRNQRNQADCHSSRQDLFDDSAAEEGEEGVGAKSDGYSQAVKKGLNNRKSALVYHLPTANRYELFSLMKEVATVDEKSNNAVVVGYPEQSDRDKATAEHDQVAMKDFLRRANIAPEDIVEIRRHGQQREGRHRPLKILTKSNEARERIIRAYRAYKPQDAPAGSYCRRDMTPTELAEDRRLKSQAYETNSKEGLKKWTVRNLQLIELKGPNLEKFIMR